MGQILNDLIQLLTVMSSYVLYHNGKAPIGQSSSQEHYGQLYNAMTIKENGGGHCGGNEVD